MTHDQFHTFTAFRDAFKTKVEEWSSDAALLSQLAVLQKAAATEDKVPDYPIETPIVYNTALDDITRDHDIRLIVIGDNPGKSEQLTTNRKYLVGQAGKIAEGFFRRNPELAIDFRKNAIILNKTPLHTAKTKELRNLIKSDRSLGNLFQETQLWMARNTAELQKALDTPESPCSIWLVGYAELKPRGLFTTYRDELIRCYKDTPASNLYVYQHFSMNCFSTDLKKSQLPGQSLPDALTMIGLNHRKEILGF